MLDRELDRARYGPTWLKDARLAKTIVDSLRYGSDQFNLYKLNAYVVMSNHVHVYIERNPVKAGLVEDPEEWPGPVHRGKSRMD